MRILTFDIEDWFHILDNSKTSCVEQWNKFESRLDVGLDIILEILELNCQKATFFVVGWMAERYPNQIRRISENGHEIGSHTHLHSLVYDQNVVDFRFDLKKSIDTIENCIGVKVTYFRAPGFSITEDTPWAFESLLENGITIDSSVFPAIRAHGGFKNFGVATPTIIECKGMKIKEFPINTFNLFGQNIIFSGGGYFRLLPFSVIKALTQKSDYIMTYFHPRDFDVNQPMVPGLSLSRKFKSYYGLNKTETKLLRWISEYDFIDLKEADNRIDWSIVESSYLI